MSDRPMQVFSPGEHIAGMSIWRETQIPLEAASARSTGAAHDMTSGRI